MKHGPRTAMIGLVAPVFVMLVVAQGLQYSDYSHTAIPGCALAAWPHLCYGAENPCDVEP